MQRFRGRIDLDNEIRKQKNRVEITRASETSSFAIWIKNFNNKNYLFKTLKENEKYRSLIVQEIANQSGTEFAPVTLANYGYNDGILIEDYRKEGFNYISGTKILLEYFSYLAKSNRIHEVLQNYNPRIYNEDKILREMNNLETIWNALEYHFRNYENKAEIIYKIMKKMANRFALDFLTMQRDRMDFNWEIEENEKTSEANLTPMFDSDKSFLLSSFSLKQNSGEDQKISDTYEKLDYYLTYSQENFTYFFYELFDSYTPEKIEEIISKIEKDNFFFMETDTKIEIIGSYKEHYQKMLEIVQKRKENELRR